MSKQFITPREASILAYIAHYSRAFGPNQECTEMVSRLKTKKCKVIAKALLSQNFKGNKAAADIWKWSAHE